MSQDNFIDYGQLIDDAMHVIVKRALEIVVEEGLPGDHHFFISFLTQYPGVEISEKLMEKYPEEMTIVLQYQFQDLEVTDEGFQVTLSFDNVKEPLKIPFAALTAFADPAVKFGLQFRYIMDDEEALALADLEDYVDGEDELDLDQPKIPNDTKKAKRRSQKAVKDDNVIALDSFRNDKKK